jgi:DNA polymerase elongation subunit (family B)
MLVELGRLIGRLPVGIVVGWNSALFDLPFLATRAEALGVELPIRLVPDPAIIPKHDFTPPHTCGYRAEIGHHQHADIAYAYQLEAQRLGVKWALKPVAKACGIEVIEVDRERMHDLSADELAAYNLSDARATSLLAERLDCWIAEWLDARHIVELEQAR